MKLIWNEQLSVGIPAIDDQHKELIKKINDLTDTIFKGEDKGQVLEFIDFLDNYVTAHFSHEETMMLKADYPEIVSHTREHAAFITRLDTFKRHFNSTGHSPELSFDTQKWLYGWLISHVSKQDRLAGAYINSRAEAG
ncbi:hypothetical protein MNBD_DELTA01-675 [hydrothermal vent metagenome]|uniref:Hemerythrin-like domain-containing protein n=1 Tax=hydrothermal vent metagenome TaxID=652676 RepID=A0A3B0QN31_9ZZZZ